MPAELIAWDFFLAHAGADLLAAETLFDLLAGRARVFLDSRCLELGDDWDRSLRRAQRGAFMSVILISRQTDDAYYQREEIAAAIDLARQDQGAGHRVVPVYLEDGIKEQETIPYGLRLKQGVVASQAGGLPGVADRLVRALERLHADNTKDPSPRETHLPPPLPPPPPPPPARYLCQCIFPSEPVSYFVTVANEIVAIPPGLPPVVVGRRIPPTMPNFAWMYQTSMLTLGVDAGGRIWNCTPQGMPFQVGYVVSL